MDLRHNAFDIRAVERHCAALRRTTPFPPLRTCRAAPLQSRCRSPSARARSGGHLGGGRGPWRGSRARHGRGSSLPRHTVAMAGGGSRVQTDSAGVNRRRHRLRRQQQGQFSLPGVCGAARVRPHATTRHAAVGVQRLHGTWRIMRSESVPGRAGLLSLSGNPLVQLHQVGNSRLQTADRRAKHGGAPPRRRCHVARRLRNFGPLSA